MFPPIYIFSLIMCYKECRIKLVCLYNRNKEQREETQRQPILVVF